jgi:hypothetical protein
MTKPKNRMPLVKTPAEKAERIATLRLINELFRDIPGSDKEFCEMLDAALLYAEDVASDAVQ